MRCRELREHLRSHLAPDNRVLILGCGNSTLAEDLYCDSLGVSDIVSVDISPTVIQNMGAQAAHRGYHELKWQVRESCNHQKSSPAASIWCGASTQKPPGEACAAALLVDHPAHSMVSSQRRSACVAASLCTHGKERQVPSSLTLLQSEAGGTQPLYLVNVATLLTSGCCLCRWQTATPGCAGRCRLLSSPGGLFVQVAPSKCAGCPPSDEPPPPPDE